MKKLLCFLLLVGTAFGQTHTFPALDTNNAWTGQNNLPVSYTVATLPSVPLAGTTAIVTDGASASDCTVGGGSTLVFCRYNSTTLTWQPVGGGVSLSGSNAWTGQNAWKQVLVSYSATPTFNATLGNSFKITLTGNVTSSTLSGALAGQWIGVTVCQDSSGGHTFTWPTNTVSTVSVTSTANQCTSVGFVSDGTTAYGFSSSGGGGGSVNTSGSPASGQLAFFTGSAIITGGTSGTLDASGNIGVNNATATGTVSAGTAYLVNGNVGTSGTYLRSDGSTGYVSSNIQSSDLSTALASPPAIGGSTPAAGTFTGITLSNAGHTSLFGVNSSNHATINQTLEVPSVINLNGNWTAGTINAVGDLLCPSGNNVASDCSTSSGSVVGVALATSGTIYPQTSGYATLNYDATVSPSVGWFACRSAITAGKVQISSSACPSNQPEVGIVSQAGSAVTSGQVWLLISGVSQANGNVAGSNLTNNAVIIGQGGNSIAPISADTTTTHALFATATSPAFRAIVVGDLPGSGATTVNGQSCALAGTCTLTLASSNFANQGTTTTVLHGNAAGNPSWGAIDLSTAQVTGNLPVTNLNGGTGATSGTFWRGDGTWAAASGSGTSVQVNTSAIAGTTANLSNTTPAAGTDQVNVSFQKDTGSPTTNISAEVGASASGASLGVVKMTSACTGVQGVQSVDSHGNLTCGTSAATYIVLKCTQTSIQAGDTITTAGVFATNCLIPANTLSAGSVIHLATGGTTTTGASTSNVWTFGVELCQVSGCASGVVVDFGRFFAGSAQNQNLTNRTWRLHGDFPIYTSGASATTRNEFDGVVTIGGAAAAAYSGAGIGPQTLTFDSTADEYLTIYENSTISSTCSATQSSLAAWVTK